MPELRHRTPKVSAAKQELTKWSCSLFGNKSEIDVFLESSGQWETAAEVHGVGKFDAEEVAAFMLEAITTFLKTRSKA